MCFKSPQMLALCKVRNSVTSVGSSVPEENLREADRPTSPDTWELDPGAEQRQRRPFPDHARVAGHLRSKLCVWPVMALMLPSHALAVAEGGGLLPACHVKVPVEHLLSQLLPLHSPWKLQMCELISQQVRLQECLRAARKKTHTRTDLEEKTRLKDVLQIETGHTYFKYTHTKKIVPKF